jgi:hypothetical protein
MAYSQHAEQRSYDLADSLIKASFGPTFTVGTLLDVDAILAMPEQERKWHGYIFDDPNHQLSHCVIVTYGSWDSMDVRYRYGSGVSLNDSGGIALVRAKRIVWSLRRIILNYGEASSRLSGFGDFNKDGVTDIIYSRYGGSHDEIEILWLVSPDSLGGKLLNAIDSFGLSTIVGAFDTFEFRVAGPEQTITIGAIDAYSERSRNINYVWNGKAFMRQSP